MELRKADCVGMTDIVGNQTNILRDRCDISHSSGPASQSQRNVPDYAGRCKATCLVRTRYAACGYLNVSVIETLIIYTQLVVRPPADGLPWKSKFWILVEPPPHLAPRGLRLYTALQKSGPARSISAFTRVAGLSGGMLLDCAEMQIVVCGALVSHVEAITFLETH